jgi:hypothetical protein
MSEEIKAVTIRDVASDLRAFADTIDGMEVDDPAREQALLDMSRAAVQSRTKVDAFVQFIRRVESEQEFIQCEIDRLTVRKAGLARMEESLKDYAVRAMKENGIRKFDGNCSTLSLRKKPDTCLIEDEAAVPSEYKTLTITIPATKWEEHIAWAQADDADGAQMLLDAVSKTDVKIDRKRLLAALKQHEEIPGADLKWGDDGLQIK